MKKDVRVFCVFSAAVALTACAIKQDVRPVMGLQAGEEVCIVEAPAVREGFVKELQESLARRGFEPRLLPEGTSPRECPLVVTYTARWSWDLTIYMSFAEINVFRDGALAGSAKYDSTRGSANMGKFIDAETKVNELVSELFPAR